MHVTGYRRRHCSHLRLFVCACPLQWSDLVEMVVRRRCPLHLHLRADERNRDLAKQRKGEDWTVKEGRHRDRIPS